MNPDELGGRVRNACELTEPRYLADPVRADSESIPLHAEEKVRGLAPSLLADEPPRASQGLRASGKDFGRLHPALPFRSRSSSAAAAWLRRASGSPSDNGAGSWGGRPA